ncbi:hypothetical protein ACW9KT_15760 [Hymenobacter sp. HD11105]
MNMLPLLITLGGICLVSCDTDASQGTTQTKRSAPAVAATRPEPEAPVAATPVPAGRPLRSEADTLRLRNGSIVQLIPAREADFARLKGVDTDTSEQKYIAQTKGRARRQADQLLLTLTNGRVLTLTNNVTDPDETTHVIYRFRGPLVGSNFWVVDVTRWESGFVLLINRQTGRRTRLLGPPVLAPDGTHLATVNSDMEAHYSPNGLQVWSLEGGIPLLRWSRVVNTWGPEEVRWLDNKTLIVRQFHPDSTPEIRYARLLLPQPPQP